MKIFKVKKGLAGIYDALYISYTQKITPYAVYNSDVFQQVLGCETILATATEEQERRVKNALIKYAGVGILSDLSVCLSSGNERDCNVAFLYAKLTLDMRANLFNAMSYPAVSDFRYVIQKVLFERHRFCGFLRFNETESGVLYAAFSPDNDITEILAPHFSKRLNNIPFMIHDVKRGKIAVWNGNSLYFSETDEKVSTVFSDNEQIIKNLYKTYFDKVNIEERKNKRQQDNFLPRRYRAFMPETWE